MKAHLLTPQLVAVGVVCAPCSCHSAPATVGRLGRGWLRGGGGAYTGACKRATHMGTQEGLQKDAPRGQGRGMQRTLFGTLQVPQG